MDISRDIATDFKILNSIIKYFETAIKKFCLHYCVLRTERIVVIDCCE